MAVPDDDDGELLGAYARRGDVESLSALVTRHSCWMRAFLRGFFSSAADADDAFQDAWERVIRSAGRWRGGRVRSYLATVARSAAIDRLRRQGRTVSLDAAGDEGGAAEQELPDPSPTPGERFESKATSEDVRRAVRALPEGPRQVLLMRIEAEMPFREIAAELGVPLGTALTWMQTATKRLKRTLGGGR